MLNPIPVFQNLCRMPYCKFDFSLLDPRIGLKFVGEFGPLIALQGWKNSNPDSMPIRICSRLNKPSWSHFSWQQFSAFPGLFRVPFCDLIISLCVYRIKVKFVVTDAPLIVLQVQKFLNPNSLPTGFYFHFNTPSWPHFSGKQCSSFLYPDC